MADRDSIALDRASVVVADRDAGLRREVVGALQRAGINQVDGAGSLAAVREALAQCAPDILVVGDDLDPHVFGFVRALRHNHLGANPFLLVLVITDPQHEAEAKLAIAAGSDGLILRPVSEDQVLQRLRLAALHRRPFVVTSDYIGPDRRAENRASAARRIGVPNPVIEKAEGALAAAAAVRPIAGTMVALLEARLDSDAYRIAFLCEHLLRACALQRAPEAALQQHMLQVLHDGAAVAERLGRFELALMYQSAVLTFAAAMARASKPEHWAGVLSELSLTAGHAAHPRTAVDELKQGTGLAADTYADRPRAPFAEIVDLKLVPGRPAEKPLTHPVPIENIANGHRLQVSAHDYVVVRGSLAMSRMQDGRRVPVARLGPGDLIGSSLGLPADGAQIYALEDSVLLRLSADSVSAAIAAADPVLRWTIAALSGSLRAVPDVYTPRSRAVSDSIEEMRAQVQGMAGYLNAVSASAALKGEAAPVAEMVDALTRELEQLVKARPDLDRRTQAVPLAAIPDRDG